MTRRCKTCVDAPRQERFSMRPGEPYTADFFWQADLSAEKSDEESRALTWLDVMGSFGRHDTGAPGDEDVSEIVFVLEDVQHAAVRHDDLSPRSRLQAVAATKSGGRRRGVEGIGAPVLRDVERQLRHPTPGAR